MEIWKPIPGYPKYEASHTGKIRIAEAAGPRVLSLSWSGFGHCIAFIRGRGCVQVGRLILAAFDGPCPDGMECSHENGNPADNHIRNLKWRTHGDNMRLRPAHNRKKSSRAIWVLKDYNVDAVFSLFTGPETIYSVAADIKISPMKLESWIKRRFLPNDIWLKKICKSFGVEPSTLYQH